MTQILVTGQEAVKPTVLKPIEQRAILKAAPFLNKICDIYPSATKRGGQPKGHAFIHDDFQAAFFPTIA